MRKGLTRLNKTPDNRDGNRAVASVAAVMKSRLFKVAVSLLLIMLLVSTLDMGELGSVLAGVVPGLLLLGVFVFLLANMVSVFKWRLIVQAQGTPVSYFYLTILFYIGLFFNNFLPTNLGGDVVKAFKLSRATGRGAEAVSSVVVDRVSSVLALLLIAVVPAILQLRVLGARISLLVLGMLVVLVAMIALLASERATRKLGNIGVLRNDRLRIRKYLKSFYYSLYDFRGHKGTLAWVMLVSLAYQGLQILTFYTLALSLNLDVPVAYFFIFIPIVLAVSMVPISLNGLGVREWSMVFLFGQVGISSAEALSLSILALLVMTIVSLAGGVFYMFDRSTPASQGEMAAMTRGTSHG